MVYKLRFLLNNDSKSEEFVDSPILLNNCEGRLTYTVRNGICYVSLWAIRSPVAAIEILIYNKMPKAAICCGAFGSDAGSNDHVNVFAFIDAGTTNLRIHVNTTNWVYASFSYPVEL